MQGFFPCANGAGAHRVAHDDEDPSDRRSPRSRFSGRRPGGPRRPSSQDVPLHGERVLAAGSARRGSTSSASTGAARGRSSFGRARSLAAGAAGGEAAPEAEDKPDVGTAERARPAAGGSATPGGVGASNRIEYRFRGRVTRLRAWFVWSPDAAAPPRRLQSAGRPEIVPRSGWSADEKIRRGPPAFRVHAPTRCRAPHGRRERLCTAAQSPAIVKAIQLYHVKGNGWNDIGYSFLVDRFGTVFEGRFGGIERNVVGAHAEGFNTGATGVAVLGEYSSLAVASAARTASSRTFSRGGWTSPTSTSDDALHLRRQRAVRAGSPCVSAHRLRSPGHGLHRLPNGALQPAHRARRRRPHPACRSSTRPRRPAPCLGRSSSRPSVGGSALDGRCLRRGRERCCLEHRGRRRRRLDMGRDERASGDLLVTRSAPLPRFGRPSGRSAGSRPLGISGSQLTPRPSRRTPTAAPT